MKKLLLGVSFVNVVIFAYSMNMPASIATSALAKQGFTNIQITAHLPFVVSAFSCGVEDIVAFKASATNVRGDRVEEITLCSGFTNGVTTRF